MVVGTRVNTERVYYNFDGQLPPVTLEPDPVTPPSMQDDLPKLITDTTLRDGAQDSRFAIFPPDVRLQYYDLLHQLDAPGRGERRSAIYAQPSEKSVEPCTRRRIADAEMPLEVFHVSAR